MMQYLLPTVAFLLEMAAFFWLARRGFHPFGTAQSVLRWTIAVGLTGMATVHFVRCGMLAEMVPPAVPAANAAVIVTGVLEVCAAVGLVLPRFSAAAGTGLAFLLTAMFPANVYAAGRLIGGLRMPGVFPRTLLQMLLIALALIAGWGVPAEK